MEDAASTGEGEGGEEEKRGEEATGGDVEAGRMSGDVVNLPR